MQATTAPPPHSLISSQFIMKFLSSLAAVLPAQPPTRVSIPIADLSQSLPAGFLQETPLTPPCRSKPAPARAPSSATDPTPSSPANQF